MSDISALREHLFAAIRGVKDGTLDVDRARAINELGKTLTDTARVEVDYLRHIGGDGSTFLTPTGSDDAALPPGIVSVRQHRLKG